MARKTDLYPCYSQFALLRQKGHLIFPSPAVLKIIKATEVVFQNRVMHNDKGIVFDKMTELKIHSAVTDQLYPGIFNASDGHYFYHRIGQESDHVSSLLKGVVSVYLNMRLKNIWKEIYS